jgi:hypothetical protein
MGIGQSGNSIRPLFDDCIQNKHPPNFDMSQFSIITVYSLWSRAAGDMVRTYNVPESRTTCTEIYYLQRQLGCNTIINTT